MFRTAKFTYTFNISARKFPLLKVLKGRKSINIITLRD